MTIKLTETKKLLKSIALDLTKEDKELNINEETKKLHRGTNSGDLPKDIQEDKPQV